MHVENDRLEVQASDGVPPFNQPADTRRICALGESTAFLQEASPQADGGVPSAPEAPHHVSGSAEAVRRMRTLPLWASRLAVNGQGVRHCAGSHTTLTGTLLIETSRSCGWVCGMLVGCVPRVIEPTVIVPERVIL